MIDSLQNLGIHGDLLDSLIKYIEDAKKQGEQYLVKVVFNLDVKRIHMDWMKYQRELAKEYLFIGNTFGAAREKVARLTTNDLKYLMVKVDKESERPLWRFDEENNVISNVRANIRQLREKNLTNINIDKLDEILEEIEATFIRNGGNVMVENPPKGAVLYTVCVQKSGRLIELAKTEGYRDLLNALIGRREYFTKGTCHVCGQYKEVLTDPAFPSGSLLKIWVKDKKGFMAGLSDSDEAGMRNFSICAECREDLLKGWAYVQKNLKVKVGDLYAYLLPGLRKELTAEQLDSLSDKVNKTFGAVSSYESLLEFDKNLQNLSELVLEESWYELTVVFGNPESAHFRLLSMVQDVPVTNLHRLREQMRETGNAACEFFGGDRKGWNLGFFDIYRLLPLRRGRERDLSDLRKVVELFSSILSFSPYPRSRLLKYAVELAKVHRFQLYELYNLSHEGGWDLELCKGLLKFNYLLKMLRDMDIIHGSEAGDETMTLTVKENNRLKKIDEWFRNMGYNGLQQALFLLGYLVGEVGHQQKNKGDTKKSILDKIDFNGMKAEKVLSLSNQILKSLRDYRILQYNELIYHHMVRLLNKHKEELRINPVENTFYLLSGYAFNTYIHDTRGGSYD